MSIKAIIFDFDGVILESVDVKTKAFASLFKDYPEHVEQIVKLHKKHGGMSRFEKFEIIYRDMLKQPISEEKKQQLGQQFSRYVYQGVLNSPFVKGVEDFLEKHYQRLPFFVASGTPEPEMRSIVKDLKLDKYFRGVYGSPAKKSEIILSILKEFNFKKEEVIFVGDSIDDEEGAEGAGVKFILQTKENNAYENLNNNFIF